MVVFFLSLALLKSQYYVFTFPSLRFEYQYEIVFNLWDGFT